MGGSTTVQAPQPSAQELALQQEQVNLLRDQRAQTQQMAQQQQLLAPYLYQQMGLNPTMGPDGQITGFQKLPEDPQQAAFKELQTQTLQAALAEANDPQNKEINTLLKSKTLAALKGDLPVDPALERNLSEGRATLEGSLRNQIGSGYATSTPGIQALAEFDKRAEELRYGARTGQLTLAEQLNNARANTASMTAQSPLPGIQLGDQLRQSRLASTLGISSLPGQAAAGFGGGAQGVGNALGWYSNQRDQQLKAQMANAQSDNSFMGSLGSLFGTGLMAYASYAAMASDRRLKTHVKLIGKLKSGLNVYRYRIFGQPAVGVMADEVRKLFPQAVHTFAPGFDAVDYSKIG
jgi:hypothetical protein